MGVKIEEFEMHIGFGPVAKDGPIVPTSADIRFEGRALFATKFDETETLQNKGFNYVVSNQ